MRTLTDAQHQFAYHPATPDTAPRHARVRDLFGALLPDLWDAVPDGPEKTLAVRALQEAQMYANLAIALTAPADTGATRSTARTLPTEPKAAGGPCDCGEPGDCPQCCCVSLEHSTRPERQCQRCTHTGYSGTGA